MYRLIAEIYVYKYLFHKRCGANLHYRQRDGVCVALTFTTVNGMVFVWR